MRIVALHELDRHTGRYGDTGSRHGGMRVGDKFRLEGWIMPRLEDDLAEIGCSLVLVLAYRSVLSGRDDRTAIYTASMTRKLLALVDCWQRLRVHQPCQSSAPIN